MLNVKLLKLVLEKCSLANNCFLCSFCEKKLHVGSTWPESILTLFFAIFNVCKSLQPMLLSNKFHKADIIDYIKQ